LFIQPVSSYFVQYSHVIVLCYSELNKINSTKSGSLCLSQALFQLFCEFPLRLQFLTDPRVCCTQSINRRAAHRR